MKTVFALSMLATVTAASIASADCTSKVIAAGTQKATQVLNPNFSLNYSDLIKFSSTQYRLELSDFANKVTADVTVDAACNILAISVDEDSVSNN